MLLSKPNRRVTKSTEHNWEVKKTVVRYWSQTRLSNMWKMKSAAHLTTPPSSLWEFSLNDQLEKDVCSDVETLLLYFPLAACRGCTLLYRLHLRVWIHILIVIFLFENLLQAFEKINLFRKHLVYVWHAKTSNLRLLTLLTGSVCLWKWCSSSHVSGSGGKRLQSDLMKM